MPDITFLGTSGALPIADRGYTSLVISDNQMGVLIDCGGVVYQSLIRAAIDPETITDLFITHAHIDHIAGLPSLLECLRLSGRVAPLRLWALRETIETVQGLLRVFAFELRLPLPYPLELHALAGDGACLSLANGELLFTRMDHSIPTVGVKLRFPRADRDAWTVVYSSDTRLTKRLDAFALGCDLLIVECTFLARQAALAAQTGHLTAEQAGQLASAAHAKRLVLVHLGLHGDWSEAEAIQEASAHYHGPLLVPSDGHRLTLD